MGSERTRYCSRCLTTFPGDPEACPNLACKTKRRKEGWGELLDPGDILDRHYRVEQHLAIGGAGVTYLAQQIGDDDQPVGPKLAIKVLYTYRDQGPYLRRLATEAQILQELIHPNIVRTMGFVARTGSSPYLLTRFEAGGSLLDHLRRVGYMPIRIVAAMGVQLCEALDMAHQKGVIHRDLKPENILLAKEAGPDELPLARLTDFGIAKVFGGVGERLTRVGAFVGTPQYAAPEQFEGLTPTPATDLYALAAVLAFCVTLEPFLPPDLVLDPVDTAAALRAKLPQRVEMGGSPEEIAAFNRFLAATTAGEPGDRIGLAGAKEQLRAIAEGRPGDAAAWEPSMESPANAGAPQEAAQPTMALPTSEARAPGRPAEPRPADPRPADPPPLSAEPIAAPLTLGTTGLTEDSLADEPPERSYRAVKLLMLLGVLAGLGGVGAFGVAWYVAPWSLPDPLRGLLPRPEVLDPNDPADAKDYAAILQVLKPAWARLSQECGISGHNTVLLDLTIEPTGGLRELAMGGLGADQSACVARGLKSETFGRTDIVPVRAAFQLGG